MIFVDVSLDFDGVLHAYRSPWTAPDIVHDGPVMGAFTAVRGYLEAGLRVAVHSSRSSFEPYIMEKWSGSERYMAETMVAVGEKHLITGSRGIDAMKNWCQFHGLGDDVEKLLWPIFLPAARIYINDRGFHFAGAFPSAEFIKTFKPWNR